MKLRLKVLIILASMWAIVSATIFIYSKSVLTQEYTKLESKEVSDDLDRTIKTLQSLFASLRTLNADWSQWNDAYAFMKNKNSEFIRSNLSFTTFENAKINFILFFNPQGKLFYGLNYDLATKQFIPIPERLLEQIEKEKTFINQRDIQTGKAGLIRVDSQYVALSALPVVTSDGEGPIRGTLVMGFYLNKGHLTHLSDIVKMKVGLDMLPLKKENASLSAVYDYLHADNKGSYIHINDENSMSGFTFVRNIEGDPIGILSIEVPRPVYQEGVKTIEQYLAIVICLGVFFLICVWYLLKAFVLDRVIHVSHEVIDITAHSTFKKRVSDNGHDELSHMVKAINSLLEIIALTEEKLKSRISLRTEELERLSLLNKNLFNEMNNQKQIEVKLREGEKRLHQMAYYDTLTGLPNRLSFNDFVQKHMEKARILNNSLVFLFLDVDKFKQINDTYGHHIGDLYLRHVAEQLKLSIKEGDVVARISGDEFLICLNDVNDKASTIGAVQLLLKNLALPLKFETLNVVSTFSIGIATYPNDGDTITQLEKHADLAMYYAKKQEGSHYCFFNEIRKEEATD